MNFCPACGTKSVGGDFCHACGFSLSRNNDSVVEPIDVGVGMFPGEGLPETIDVLLEHLGQSPENHKYWKDSVSNGSWKKIPFGKKTVKVKSGGEHSDVDQLVSVTISEIRDWSSDVEAPLTWLVLKAESGIYVYATGQMYLLERGEWSLVGSIDTAWEEDQVAATFGSLAQIFIGIDWADDFSDRNEYLRPYLEQSPAAISWFESVTDADFEDEDFLRIPDIDGPEIWISANSWDGPFLGPISPDPNSDFHRLRLLAVSLAQNGLDVSVDYGPFVQTYEEWYSDAGEHSGEVFLSAESPSTITSNGVVPVLNLMSCEENEEKFVLQQLKKFGLNLS